MLYSGSLLLLADYDNAKSLATIVVRRSCRCGCSCRIWRAPFRHSSVP